MLAVRSLVLSALVLTLSGATAPARAQSPKPGDYFEGGVLGFKVRVPKDWEFVPPQPGEPTLIGKYVPSNTKYIELGAKETSEDALFLNVWLVQFDQRKKPEGQAEKGQPRIVQKPAVDLAEWIKKSGEVPGGAWRLLEETPLKLGAVQAKEQVHIGVLHGAKGPEIRLYAALFPVAEGYQVALVGIGPGEKKWRDYEQAFQKMGKSFQLVEPKEAGASSGGGKKGGAVGMDSPLRKQKREELRAQIATNPGWKLYETANYFVVSDNEDTQFIKELMERLEAIREVYEQDYPPDRARAAVPTKGGDDDDEEPEAPEADGEPEDGEDPAPKKHETVEGIDSRELSRCSVVRVCKDDDLYREYGGPGGSAGYWSSYHKELVIYDDQQGGGRNNTWATLNHEAFHQYIYYFYGNLAPHSWYNEGTGDFYSGYQLKGAKFKLQPFDWRTGTIKENIRGGEIVPLQEFVRFRQPQYYGQSNYGTSIGDHYAQGWSFIWFLRTGKGKAKGFDPAWSTILDTYLEVLRSTGDLDKAVDEAFKGVDWAAMEACWKAYIG